MHKLFLILFVLLYIDDVYFWVEKDKPVNSTKYTVYTEVNTDSIPQPISNNQIELIHAQDTTITIVVHRP